LREAPEMGLETLGKGFLGVSEHLKRLVELF
jgi:hypothetical protein